MDDLMTKEEIGAAREWSGLGDEATDEQIVEATKDTMWLARRRLNAAISRLANEISTCIKEDANSVKDELIRICEIFKS